MRILPRVAGVALAVCGASCSGPFTTPQVQPFNKITSFYDYGASDRDLKLTVRGDPFAMPEESFAKAVESGVQVPLPRPPTRPRLDPGPSARPGYELAFAFSPAPTLSGDSLCDMTARPSPVAIPSDGGRVRATGAFCVAGRALSQVDGWTQASSVSDQRFDQMLNQMMQSLFRPDIADTGDGRSGR